MPIKVVVQWSSFGPFHLARLEAAYAELKQAGIRVVGLEMTSRKEMFAWEQITKPSIFERYLAVPGKSYEHASRRELWRGVMSVLDQVDPAVVATNGYSNYDAWSALSWCKLHHRSAILMSDSRAEDCPRVAWRERAKQAIVRRYDSAICAGKPQRRYLEFLGVPSNRIFEGLDAVDNDFFSRAAERASSNRDGFRRLPGLDTPGPFFLACARFVACKNLDGLLRAYAVYRRKATAVSDGGAPWPLLIVGDGVERPALELLIQAENIQGVTLCGIQQIDNMTAYYGLASVFVHPALQDTWGLVVNEAMAAGLPVLVSEESGCALDLVRDGENGFTFASRDTEGLADLMLSMASDRVDLKAMGHASRRIIKEWGPSRFAEGLYRAVDAALDASGQSGHRKLEPRPTR